MTSSSMPGALGRERGRVANLGSQLRRVRLDAKLSAREVARQVDVSPSFISQIETGKSQPSVLTLYSLARLFDITIDELFEAPDDDGRVVPVPTEEAASITSADAILAGSNAFDLEDGHGKPADGQPTGSGISIVRLHERATLRLQSGVRWQRLAVTSDQGINFMEVVYPVGSASTSDSSMLRHEGYEYHYILSGTLQVTVNFDEYILNQTDSIGFDSSLPHLLRNPGDVDTHCIVTTHREAGA
jgi:transcriptional regulator with XRE-family HTH domain/quercetin dioxygenase-like cupin family protein